MFALFAYVSDVSHAFKTQLGQFNDNRTRLVTTEHNFFFKYLFPFTGWMALSVKTDFQRGPHIKKQSLQVKYKVYSIQITKCNNKIQTYLERHKCEMQKCS